MSVEHVKAALLGQVVPTITVLEGDRTPGDEGTTSMPWLPGGVVDRVDRRGCRVVPPAGARRAFFIRWNTGRARPYCGVEVVLHPLVVEWAKHTMGAK